jgi:hypothetical protein
MKGKLWAPWIEKVKTLGSPARIAAVPLPWWTSQSMMTDPAARPSACMTRAATARR